MSTDFEVLSPWGDVDPIPLKGLSPRLSSLAGKKIGLFALSKQAARPIVLAVGEKLKQKYPGVETVLYDSYAPWTIMIVDTEHRGRFEDWLKGVDAVIAAVGD